MASDYGLNFVVKRFLLLQTPLAVILGLVVLFSYYQEYKNEKHLLETTETQLLGDDLLESLKEVASKCKSRFMLLNSNGYWLLALGKEKQCGGYTNKTKQDTAGIFNLVTDALVAVKSEVLTSIR